MHLRSRMFHGPIGDLVFCYSVLKRDSLEEDNLNGAAYKKSLTPNSLKTHLGL